MDAGLAGDDTAGWADEGAGSAGARPLSALRAMQKSGKSQVFGILRIKCLIGFPSWSDN